LAAGNAAPHLVAGAAETISKHLDVPMSMRPASRRGALAASFLVAIAVAAISLSAACASSTEPAPNGPAPTLDQLPRPLTAGEQRVIGAANDFSFALFRRLSAAQVDSNVFTSPLSASMALGMTMNGASGTTYDEMRSTLGFSAGATESEMGESYRSLIALLRALDPGVDFRIANSIWYRNGLPVQPTFLDAGRNWFDAQVSALDFTSPSAVSTINDWVSTSTAGRIPTILDRIEPDQVMFLIDAIYFKGSWRTRFDPSRTVTATFHGTGGDQPAKLMRRDGMMGWLGTPEFEAIDIPYGSGAYSMTVLLPAEGTRVDDVAASIGSSAWATWMGRFHDTDVELQLPRFKLSWERELTAELQSLGMRAAFEDGRADFSRMASGVQLYISLVKQKTYVDVNEEGTEAAAVTNVGISVTSLPVRRSFIVDRPFVFVLRERLSGTILFIGKIVRLP
jgi:serpin B